jgi:hypothetical protein
VTSESKFLVLGVVIALGMLVLGTTLEALRRDVSEIRADFEGLVLREDLKPGGAFLRASESTDEDGDGA